MLVRAGALGVCGVVLGCSVVEDGSVTSYTDQGSVCLRSTDSGALELTVTFPGCLSSSCDRALEASCSVNEAGGEIVIRSRGQSEATGARVCTTDCGLLQAFCESEALPDGDYVVVHGSDSASVTLPQAALLLFPDHNPRADCGP